jgi:hypothetical protein
LSPPEGPARWRRRTPQALVDRADYDDVTGEFPQVREIKLLAFAEISALDGARLP